MFMDESTFWRFIEKAWSVTPDLKRKRSSLAKESQYPKPADATGNALEKAIQHEVYPTLEKN